MHGLKQFIYSFSVTETKGPKSKCLQGCAFSKGSEREAFLASSSWRLPATLGWWWHPSHLCLHHYMGLPLHVSRCVLSSSYKDTNHWIQGPPSSSMTSSQRITSAMTLFPNKVNIHKFQRFGQGCVFWGQPLNPLPWPCLGEEKANPVRLRGPHPPSPLVPLLKKNWGLEKEA